MQNDTQKVNETSQINIEWNSAAAALKTVRNLRGNVNGSSCTSHYNALEKNVIIYQRKFQALQVELVKIKHILIKITFMHYFEIKNEYYYYLLNTFAINS